MEGKIFPRIARLSEHVDELIMDTDKISKGTNSEKRKQLSLETARLYKVEDKNGVESKIAVFVGELDIRFGLENFRGEPRRMFRRLGIRPEETTHNMVFSSNAVGDAIVTDKPVIKKKLKRSAVTGKFGKSDGTIRALDVTHINKVEGSSTGVTLPYSNDVYKRLTQLRTEIVRLLENIKVIKIAMPSIK